MALLEADQCEEDRGGSDEIEVGILVCSSKDPNEEERQMVNSEHRFGRRGKPGNCQLSDW